MIDLATQITFLNFIEFKIPAEEFETYLYTSQSLEKELGGNLYSDIMTINYNGKDCRKELNEKIQSIFDYTEIHKTQIIEVIDAILSKQSIIAGLEKLHSWAWKGYSFLGHVDVIGNFGEQGKSIILRIEGEDTEEEIFEKVKLYQPDLEECLLDIKIRMQKGQIVLTGEMKQGIYSQYFGYRELP